MRAGSAEPITPRRRKNRRGPLEAAPARVIKLEEAIANERGNDGPYFNDDRLCLVDAAYAPFLQRFAIVERTLRTGLMKDFSHVQSWSNVLLANEVVSGSVVATFEDEFIAGLKRREFYVGTLFAEVSA